MGNPSITQQNSCIFEPLFSLHEQEPPCPQPSSSEWLSSTCAPLPLQSSSSSPPPRLRHASSELLSRSNGSAQNLDPIHCIDGESSPSVSAMDGHQFAPPTRSLSSGNVSKNDGGDDDGSVACKLLSSITKSISSPSLLACCKESVRETEYQKALRLRTMKLQHCAEELGSESSDGASAYGDGGDSDAFGAICSKSSTPRSSVMASCLSSSSSMPQKDEMAECDSSPAAMVSVRSAPNLGCPSLISRHRERSFPPPLSYTLPRSSSADAFSFSLRACRENGRLVLTEVKVPCRQYLRASRENGRLTLRLCTADEAMGPEDLAHDAQELDAMDPHQGDCQLESEADVDEAGDCSSHGDGEREKSNDLRDGLKRRRDDAALFTLQHTEESSDGLAALNDSKHIRSLSASCLPRQGFDAENGCVVDESACPALSNAPIKHAKRHLWKKQSTAGKNTAICSGYGSPTLAVTPASRSVHGEDNLVHQTTSRRQAPDATRRLKTMGVESSSAIILPRVGYNIDRKAPPTIIFKDVGANSLMEDVAKLVSSFGLEGAKWCPGRKEPREQDRRRSATARNHHHHHHHHHHQDSTIMAIDATRGMSSGFKQINEESPKVACGTDVLNLACSRMPQSTDALEEKGGDDSILKSTATIQLDKIPLHLGWLHSSHCKELFDRSFVNKGISCVAITS